MSEVVRELGNRYVIDMLSHLRKEMREERDQRVKGLGGWK